MNYRLGDRVMVTDIFSYYWSCVGTVVKVEAQQITLFMPITGQKILRSAGIDFVERG